MSLNEVIESVKNSPTKWVQYAGPIQLYSDDGKSLIVFDRTRKEFVRSSNIPMFGKPSETDPDRGESPLGFVDWVEDKAYQTADLFRITRKYGLGTAMKYESKVIKANFKRLVHQPAYDTGYMNHKAA